MDRRIIVAAALVMGLFACTGSGGPYSNDANEGVWEDAGPVLDGGSIPDGGIFGIVSTVAGVDADGGFKDGTGGANGTAEFNVPSGMVMDSQGDLFVADSDNNRIRKVDPTGNVTTFAGTGAAGFVDGPAASAQFTNPSGLALDSHGNLFVADLGNNRVRKIDASGNVTTVAGNGYTTPTGMGGYMDGTGGPTGTTEFYWPTGVAVDSLGDLYVTDQGNNAIRFIDPQGNTLTWAGNGTSGYADGPGGQAQFAQPQGIIIDAQGNLYVADTNNNRVRKINAAGNVSTFAGNGTEGNSDGAGGTTGPAQFNQPTGLALSVQNYVYVADTFNNRIRFIDSAGTVVSVVGNGVAGYEDGTGGIFGAAEFNAPLGLALDKAGNVYVSDTGNNRIRRFQP